MCDLRAAQKYFRAGNVSDTRMVFLYNQFREFCAMLQIEHWINDPALPVAEILQVYGYRVRHGRWSKLPEVRTESVSVALQDIATVHLLGGRPDTQKPCGSSSCNLYLRLSLQIHIYYFQDLPISQKKPVPRGVAVADARGASSNPNDQFLADLVQIGLYFCLRSCEYTKTNSHRRTTQFRLRDIQFQDAYGAISFDALASRFLNALVVTFFLDTQKNSVRGESISMENTHLILGCPVVAFARRFLDLRDNNADLDMPMCVYF